MKKLFAALLATLLALALFCLPIAAAPTQDEMDGLTPYGLTAEAIPDANGAALLTFQIVGLSADLPGMEPGDDIHTLVEYRRGAGDWEPYHNYGSFEMMEGFQASPGAFKMRFDWVFDNEWDGEEPVFFRAYCEYYQYGVAGTGLVSGYSNVAFIGVAGEGVTEPTTVGIEPVPYEEPVVLPRIPSVDYTLFIIIGIGLLLLLLIVIIVVVSKKKRKN